MKIDLNPSLKIKRFSEIEAGEAFIVGKWALFMKISKNKGVDLRDGILMGFRKTEKYEIAKVKIVKDDD